MAQYLVPKWYYVRDWWGIVKYFIGVRTKTKLKGEYMEEGKKRKWKCVGCGHEVETHEHEGTPEECPYCNDRMEEVGWGGGC